MGMKYSRYCSGLLLSLSLSGLAVSQQPYPSKPIHLILPQTAGTGVDIVLRKAFESMQQRMGQPFIVDYHPGSNQMAGAELCARAAPDGHTICALSVDPLALNPHIFAKLPYDPFKDYKPVTSLYYIVSGWFGKATLAANSMANCAHLPLQSRARSTGRHWARKPIPTSRASGWVSCGKPVLPAFPTRVGRPS